MTARTQQVRFLYTFCQFGTAIVNIHYSGLSPIEHRNWMLIKVRCGVFKVHAAVRGQETIKRTIKHEMRFLEENPKSRVDWTVYA